MYYDNYSGPQFLFLIIIVLEIFSSEVDDIFYFVFRKIFFLIRLYFNHDDGKFEKKEKQRTILRQSYRILSRVRCLFVLRLKKYKHIKPPWTVFFFINIYIYIYISITMISMIFIFCPLLSILFTFLFKMNILSVFYNIMSQTTIQFMEDWTFVLINFVRFILNFSNARNSNIA